MKELIIVVGVNGTGKSSFKVFGFIKLIQGTLNGYPELMELKMGLEPTTY